MFSCEVLLKDILKHKYLLIVFRRACFEFTMLACSKVIAVVMEKYKIFIDFLCSRYQRLIIVRGIDYTYIYI
jgi:hypothetical protein